MASKGGSLLGDLLVAQLFEGKKDNAFYLVEDLQQLAQVAGIAKTRIRFFWQQKANGEWRVYGVHTGEDTPYEGVRVN